MLATGIRLLAYKHRVYVVLGRQSIRLARLSNNLENDFDTHEAE